MRIRFEVAGMPAEVSRNWITGRMVLRVGEDAAALQRVRDADTHNSWLLSRSWFYETGGHIVVIEKVRPRFLAAFRPHTYRVWVNEELVVERRGY